MKRPGFKVAYHELVAKIDIPRLDKTAALRVKTAIENKLVSRPEIFGSPLRATLKGYWKLRVGDWRVVYLIKSKVVKIIFIGHRREVYGLVKRRISV